MTWVPSHWRFNLCNLSRQELGKPELTNSHMVPASQVLNPKYEVDPYMATIFESETFKLVLRVGLNKNLDPTSNTCPQIGFH